MLTVRDNKRAKQALINKYELLDCNVEKYIGTGDKLYYKSKMQVPFEHTIQLTKFAKFFDLMGHFILSLDYLKLFEAQSFAAKYYFTSLLIFLALFALVLL